MAADLAGARRQANLIRTHMRVGKILPAIQALHDTVVTMASNPLLRAEKEEFERLIADGASYIMSSQEVRTAAAVDIAYTPGKEKELMENLRMLMEVYQDSMKEDAEKAIKAMDQRRVTLLNEGQAHLDNNSVDSARKTFNTLASENQGNAMVHGVIGERFLNKGLYEDAIKHLALAIELDPNIAHLYNLIGIALRKVKKYEQAEQYYLKVSSVLGKDPHLFFNLARLYVDWEFWDKAIRAAEGSLKLDPDFEEAKKLLRFAEKQKAKAMEVAAKKLENEDGNNEDMFL